MVQLLGGNRKESKILQKEQAFPLQSLKKKKKNLCYFTIWKSFEVDSEISKSRDSGMAESVGTLSFPIFLSEKPSELMPELSWVTRDQHLKEQILLLNLFKVEERLLQFSYKGWGWNNSRWLEARHFNLRSLLPHETFIHFSISQFLIVIQSKLYKSEF